MRVIWMLAVILVGHLRTSRKRGSHNEKTHGTRAGFGADGPKAFRKRQADKGRKIASKGEKGGPRPEGRDRRPEEVAIVGLSGDRARALAERSAGAENYLAARFPDLSSRWKGIVKTAPQENLGHFAFKSRSCSIAMSEEALGGMIKRDETLLHEMLHAYSPDRDKEQERRHYVSQPGWEEAIVEMQNRLNYPDFLKYTGESEDEVEWRKMIADDTRFKTHPYNRFIDPLEKVRKAMRMKPEKFYDELLHVPASKRYDFLQDRIRNRYREKNYGKFSKISHALREADSAMYGGRQ